MIDGRFYKLSGNVHVAAFGKAVAGMVRAAEDVLGDHVVGGVAIVPVGLQDVMRANNKTYVDTFGGRGQFHRHRRKQFIQWK